MSMELITQESSIETRPKTEKPAVMAPSAEKTVRKNVLDRQKKIDEILVQQIGAEKGEVSELIERVEAVETLSFGKMIERKRMGDGSVNAVMRVKLESEQGEMTAFMKQRSGEAYFDMDGTPLVYSIADDKYFRNENEEVDEDQSFIARQWSSEAFQNEYAIQMAKQYGIPAQDFETYKASLRPERFGPRVDIPPDGFIPREVAMSRMDMLCGFDVIPPTSAREIDRMVQDEQMGTRVVKDLASVQKGVESTDPKRPARYLHAEEFEAFLSQPPSEWHKTMGIEYEPEVLEQMKKEGRLTEPQESMSRLATLDWLMGSQDRHFENMFIDPATGKMKGIDNGLHSGRARGLKIAHGPEEWTMEPGKNTKEKSDPTASIRQLRSIPLEIMLEQSNLRLSPRDQSQMKKIYDGMLAGGPEKEVIEQTYKMMFPDIREARVQMLQFISRLKYIVDHGRPGLASGELFPVGILTMERFRKAQEPAN